MPPRPKYRWNATAARYVDVRGRFVPRAKVRRALERALKTRQRKMKALGTQLQTRQITLQRFRLEMRDGIRAVHGYGSMLARGGFDQMSPAAWGKVGSLVKFEYEKLDQMIAKIEAGKMPLDGRWMGYVGQYAEAGWHTYHLAEVEEQAKRGMDEWRSVMDPDADHCMGENGCVEQAEKGWKPIGRGGIIPIGERRCIRKCRCHYEFRKAA